MAYDVKGGAAGAGQRIRLTGDGRASCNGGELRAIASQQLIDARAVERDVKHLAERATRIGRPRPGRRDYELRTKDGTVSWVEGAPGLPPELGKAALLELQLERGICR